MKESIALVRRVPSRSPLGDPAKVAWVVLQVAAMDDPPLRLILGSDDTYRMELVRSWMVAWGLMLAATGSALADGPVQPDPSSNYAPGPMPAACMTAPTGASCVNAAVYYLDQARANLGLGPYDLPADFPSLTPTEQAFILTNLDRMAYGLDPVPGLTDELDADAEQGVYGDTDPTSTDSDFNDYSSNWAGSFTNMPLAYEAWVYDDGPGSANEDCASSDSSGCWGHRHTVLYEFDDPNPLAMGAAAGADGSGADGYAMLLGQGDGDYKPSYSYTWTQAQQDGAGTNSYQPGLPQTPVAGSVSVTGSVSSSGERSPGRETGSGARSGAAKPRLRISRLRIRRHTITILIAAQSGAALRCSLTDRVRSRYARGHFVHCASTTIYDGVAAGRWRLRVKDRRLERTRYVSVR